MLRREIAGLLASAFGFPVSLSSVAKIMHSTGFAMTLQTIAIMTALALPADTPETKYRFTLRKADDAIVAKPDGKLTVFVIKSKSGIGEGTIRLDSGNWPTHALIRFEYSRGEGFQMLESFTLDTDRIHVGGSKSESGKLGFSFVGPDGKGDGGFAGTLDAKVEIRGGAIEVTLPPNLLTGTKELKIHWIDAFRN